MTQKTGYPKETLQEFEERIEKKLQEEQKLLNEAQAEFKEAYEEIETLNGIDRQRCIDRKDAAAKMVQRSRQVIKLCQKALARIDAGTYGICRTSGKTISIQRLRKSPLTDESIATKIQTGSQVARQAVV